MSKSKPITEFGTDDFLDHFHFISEKLKKRLLRKPNVAEACDQFSNLAVQCESLSLEPQAGMCWLAAARCGRSLGYTSGEAGYLIRAARQFLSAEKKLQEIGCSSLGHEHLQAAISSYSHAASRFPKNSPLTTGLWLELGSAIEHSVSVTTAEPFYTLAATTESPAGHVRCQIDCLRRVASCKIQQEDYAGALLIFSDIAILLDTIANETPTLTKFYIDIRQDCEISRVILLLILRPTPQRLAAPLAKLLEKYTWGKCDDKSVEESGISEELFILLQSLVMACQATDTSMLPILEADLNPFLSVEQCDLLRTLVRINYP